MNSLNARVATAVRSQAGVKGWSTNRLASESGEPTPNVRRYFWTGERSIPLEALEKVAAAFGWSLSELLRRAEATEPEAFVEPRARTSRPLSEVRPSAQPETQRSRGGMARVDVGSASKKVVPTTANVSD